MRTDGPLKSRYREILIAVVRAYIETGEPVGSRTISKLREDSLSPASVRNVMADLADEGYLSQPHTSAGRVPTEKAFRYYVSSLTAARMAAAQSAGLARSPPVIMSRTLPSRSSPGPVTASIWCQYAGVRSMTVTCSAAR